MSVDLATRGAAASRVTATSSTTQPQGASRFERLKQVARAVLPLGVRKAIARMLGRQTWLSARHWWVQELLRDFSEQDPNAYHRFLWAHHFCYAETYEVDQRFGPDQIHATRHMLFDDLEQCLADIGLGSSSVTSVFEVGSSLGYNLRFLESGLFSGAQRLEGCDIDAYAIARGDAYLRSMGSRVRLSVADMAELNQKLDGRVYDVMLCAGVLMYLDPDEAERVVASMLRHTKVIVAFAGLAHPERDNATLQTSCVRSRDRTFIHNIDLMVKRAGGRVVRRRWEGPRLVDGNTIYFVFAMRGFA